MRDKEYAFAQGSPAERDGIAIIRQVSFKGFVEAKCPGECLPFEVEIWTFVRGDTDPELREILIAGELNLLMCPECGQPFFPEESFVYFEPGLELLAFVFPSSYRKEEARWREKMHEDFETLRKGMGGDLSQDMEPDIFFDIRDLISLLENEDYRYEEFQVMEYLAKELGLSIYRVSPHHSRSSGAPALLPYVEGKKGATLGSVLDGLKKALAANDRLTAYVRYLEELSASGEKELPPPFTGNRPPGML